MVGNDVVDLGDPETQEGAIHLRFDDRVFTAGERRRVREARDPRRARWTYWAAKESAYKAAKALDPAVIFSPAAFEVAFRSSENTIGTVRHTSGRFRLHVEAQGAAIHAVVLPERSENRRLVTGHRRVDTLPADGDPVRLARGTVRQLALESVAGAVGFKPEELAVRHVGKIPVLRRLGQDLPGSLSLSHHGRFVAFAYLHDSRTIVGGPPSGADRRRRGRD